MLIQQVHCLLPFHLDELTCLHVFFRMRTSHRINLLTVMEVSLHCPLKLSFKMDVFMFDAGEVVDNSSKTLVLIGCNSKFRLII
jgi:hypothetical protein